MAKFEGRVVIKRKNIVHKNLNFSEIICWSTRKICYLKIPCGKGLAIIQHREKILKASSNF